MEPTPGRDAAPPVRSSLELSWSVTQPAEEAWNATSARQGVYKWFLCGSLPERFEWADHLRVITAGDLLYVGKATSLRTRAKHHKLQTSKSTFRRALAALMGLQAQWSGKSAHPRLIPQHEEVLSEWMRNNLTMTFAEVPEPMQLKSVEETLRMELQAPLNRDALTPEQQYVSAAAAVMQRAAIGAKELR